MNKRPLSITIISVMLMILGMALLIALLVEKPDPEQAQRIADFKAQHPFHYKFDQYFPLTVIQVLTIFCGALMFFGVNFGRRLFLVWIALHLFIGLLNSPSSLIVHGILFSVIIYFLFNRRANAYFRRL